MNREQDSEVDISRVKDKALLLYHLWLNTRHQGMGFLHRGRGFKSVEDVRSLIYNNYDGKLGYLDYVCGKPIKMDLSRDNVDAYCYDRDAGKGTCSRVVAHVLEIQNEQQE